MTAARWGLSLLAGTIWTLGALYLGRLLGELAHRFQSR